MDYEEILAELATAQAASAKARKRVLSELRAAKFGNYWLTPEETDDLNAEADAAAAYAREVQFAIAKARQQRAHKAREDFAKHQEDRKAEKHDRTLRFERAFLRVAKLRLTGDVYEAIRNEADALAREEGQGVPA